MSNIKDIIKIKEDLPPPVEINGEKVFWDILQP